MRDFKKLTVWQKAHSLTLGVYKITANFPRDMSYTDLLRRYGELVLLFRLILPKVVVEMKKPNSVVF